MKAHKEGGPYNIIATQTDQGNITGEVTLHDVLFGEVWLCSGQSNMQMALIVVSYQLRDKIAMEKALQFSIDLFYLSK